MKQRTLLNFIVSVLAMAAGFANSVQAQTVMEAIAQSPNLTTAAKLFRDAGLADSLSGTGPVTVFVPNDAAFGAIPAAQLAELTGNKEMLKTVLSYHIVPVSITTETVTNGAQKTATGDSVSLYKSGAFLTVESAVVTQADVKASNGMVQVIDTVLIPPKK